MDKIEKRENCYCSSPFCLAIWLKILV